MVIDSLQQILANCLGVGNQQLRLDLVEIT